MTFVPLSKDRVLDYDCAPINSFVEVDDIRSSLLGLKRGLVFSIEFKCKVCGFVSGVGFNEHEGVGLYCFNCWVDTWFPAFKDSCSHVVDGSVTDDSTTVNPVLSRGEKDNTPKGVYTRVEVIGNGREYVYYGPVELSIQDNEQTIKVFRLPDKTGSIPPCECRSSRQSSKVAGTSPSKDDMTMVCGHFGREWSSVWKMCIACSKQGVVPTKEKRTTAYCNHTGFCGSHLPPDICFYGGGQRE